MDKALAKNQSRRGGSSAKGAKGVGKSDRQALPKNRPQSKSPREAAKQKLPGDRPHFRNHSNPEGGRLETSGP